MLPYMFQYYAEDSARFIGDRDLDVVRELNSGLKSFSDWATEHTRTSSKHQPADLLQT